MSKKKRVYIVRDAGYYLFGPNCETVPAKKRFYGETKDEAESNYQDQIDDEWWNIYEKNRD